MNYRKFKKKIQKQKTQRLSTLSREKKIKGVHNDSGNLYKKNILLPL